MISMFPIRNNINNAILNAQKAMPLKDSTSDGTSSFAMARKDYVNTFSFIPMTKQKAVVRESVGRSYTSMNKVFDSAHTDLQKKWIGGNRDASQIVANRRINSVGVGSLNSAATPFAYTTKNDPNAVREAKHRVRSGGSVVPAKKIHKYANPPIFY
jgi:hypothetical protein